MTRPCHSPIVRAAVALTAAVVALGPAGPVLGASLFTEPVLSEIVAPAAILVEDIDGDGQPDVLVTHDPSGPRPDLAVFLGNGDGPFGGRVNTDVGGPPTAAAAGHLNADPHLDVVVTVTSADQARVLLGQGDGSFTVQPPLATGTGPLSLALDFLDADAHLDLVVASEPGYDPDIDDFRDVELSVYLGNGDGTFGPENRIVLGDDRIRQVITGQFNGDTFIDVVVLTRNLNGEVRMLAGNGDGTLATPVTVFSGGQLTSLASGDIRSVERPRPRRE